MGLVVGRVVKILWGAEWISRPITTDRRLPNRRPLRQNHLQMPDENEPKPYQLALSRLPAKCTIALNYCQATQSILVITATFALANFARTLISENFLRIMRQVLGLGRTKNWCWTGPEKAKIKMQPDQGEAAQTIWWQTLARNAVVGLVFIRQKPKCRPTKARLT